jgi:hypothetical protein
LLLFTMIAAAAPTAMMTVRAFPDAQALSQCEPQR